MEHSDKRNSALNLYAIEISLEALSATDIRFMAPLAKVVYASGREIDDSFLYYHSNEVDKLCDYEYVLKSLLRYFPNSLVLLKYKKISGT